MSLASNGIIIIISEALSAVCRQNLLSFFFFPSLVLLAPRSAAEHRTVMYLGEIGSGLTRHRAERVCCALTDL